MITDANSVFVFGSQTNAINTTIAYNAWTGLATNWTSNGQHCVNWGNGSNANSGGYGTSSLNDAQSITSGINDTCDTLDNLYCVEQ